MPRMSLAIKCLRLCVKLQAQFHVDVSFVTASNTFVSTTVNQGALRLRQLKVWLLTVNVVLITIFFFSMKKDN